MSTSTIAWLLFMAFVGGLVIGGVGVSMLMLKRLREVERDFEDLAAVAVAELEAAPVPTSPVVALESELPPQWGTRAEDRRRRELVARTPREPVHISPVVMAAAVVMSATSSAVKRVQAIGRARVEPPEGIGRHSAEWAVGTATQRMALELEAVGELEGVDMTGELARITWLHETGQLAGMSSDT